MDAGPAPGSISKYTVRQLLPMPCMPTAGHGRSIGSAGGVAARLGIAPITQPSIYFLVQVCTGGGTSRV
ncbi:hypothetical protein E2562_035646 [Oryza meyeriana var. granulata]|uniref:Uncharacterized protein n=1 Tax=Oryza meyeriana var. granulata TaxID=110450 RepID=A0A6G1E7Y2_9ORYZ|nr:hypothetical protein E2562_035646 [Oryza meyeriana var. granulata]